MYGYSENEIIKMQGALNEVGVALERINPTIAEQMKNTWYLLERLLERGQASE